MREAATICPAPCKLTFDLESGVRVTCDVAYLCANFSLPRPLCSRLRPDVLYATDVRRALLLNSTTLGDIMIGSVCKNIRQSLVYAFNMPRVYQFKQHEILHQSTAISTTKRKHTNMKCTVVHYVIAIKRK